MSLMAKQQKAKAEEFISAAESKLQSKGWSMFSSKERDAEDAAEAYEKAANAYKVGGLHQEAGDAYMKAADLYRTKANSPTDASKCINNAGRSHGVLRSQRARSRANIPIIHNDGRQYGWRSLERHDDSHRSLHHPSEAWIDGWMHACIFPTKYMCKHKARQSTWSAEFPVGQMFCLLPLHLHSEFVVAP
mmetsp:Transcript_23854/g.66641  ORF Transcript_23854/g.66641 Transcript_23854/m.66641 type:complete len:190 (+) Transcript_23854:135-704(+)